MVASFQLTTLRHRTHVRAGPEPVLGEAMAARVRGSVVDASSSTGSVPMDPSHCRAECSGTAAQTASCPTGCWRWPAAAAGQMEIAAVPQLCLIDVGGPVVEVDLSLQTLLKILFPDAIDRA